MKKLTFEEFISALREKTNWMNHEEIDEFVAFIEKYRLKTRFINAVNANYKDSDEDALDHNLTCAFRSDMISCFINWELSTDDNWSEINVLWQEYNGRGEATSCNR